MNLGEVLSRDQWCCRLQKPVNITSRQYRWTRRFQWRIWRPIGILILRSNIFALWNWISTIIFPVLSSMSLFTLILVLPCLHRNVKPILTANTPKLQSSPEHFSSQQVPSPTVWLPRKWKEIPDYKNKNQVLPFFFALRFPKQRLPMTNKQNPDKLVPIELSGPLNSYIYFLSLQGINKNRIHGILWLSQVVGQFLSNQTQ